MLENVVRCENYIIMGDMSLWGWFCGTWVEFIDHWVCTHGYFDSVFIDSIVYDHVGYRDVLKPLLRDQSINRHYRHFIIQFYLCARMGTGTGCLFSSVVSLQTFVSTSWFHPVNFSPPIILFWQVEIQNVCHSKSFNSVLPTFAHNNYYASSTTPPATRGDFLNQIISFYYLIIYMLENVVPLTDMTKTTSSWGDMSLRGWF